MILAAIRKAFRAKKSRRRPYRFRPWLEALEGRLVPASIKWEGDVSGNCNDGQNWEGGNVPGVNDTALLDAPSGGVAAYPYVNAGDTLTVGNVLALQGFAGGTLDIDGTLIVAGGPGPSVWAENADLIGDGVLIIRGDHFLWSKGKLHVHEVAVEQGGRLWASGDAWDMDQVRQVVVGTAGTYGDFVIGGTGDRAINNDLVLHDDCEVLVNTYGYLYFDTTNGPGKGGLIGGGSVVSQGVIEFIASASVKCETPFTLEGGYMELGEGAAVTIDNPAGAKSVSVAGGSLVFNDESFLLAWRDLELSDGDVTVLSPDGGEEAAMAGEFTMTGGELIVGSVDGNYAKFDLRGSLVIHGGTIRLNVDGSTEGTGDWIECGDQDQNGDGIAWLLIQNVNTAVLVVTTDHQQPAAGWVYRLIADASGDPLQDPAFFDFDEVQFEGYYPDLSYDFGPKLVNNSEYSIRAN